MKLEIKHIQHYPIGGENALIVRYEKYPNPLEIIGIHQYSKGRYFLRMQGDWGDGNIGTSTGVLNLTKPILKPMSDLYKEIDGKVGIVELAKMLGDFKELLSVSVDDNNVDYKGSPAPYYECKYVSDIDDDIHSTLVFCPDTVSFERLIIYNVHLTRPVSASDFQTAPIRCYNQFYEYLFQHHYDVFGLIDKGLAIDINEIK